MTSSLCNCEVSLSVKKDITLPRANACFAWCISRFNLDPISVDYLPMSNRILKVSRIHNFFKNVATNGNLNLPSHVTAIPSQLLYLIREPLYENR